MSKVVVFHSGKEDYALPIANVISIEKFSRVTPIPHLPKFVMGLVKARGELVPVIDLGAVLYEKVSAQTEHLRLIVIHSETLNVGLLVQEAKEIIDVPSDNVKDIGLLAYSKTKYFSGVINLEDRLITMIDTHILVESLEGIKEIKEYINSQKDEVNL
jgi:purine-binding chemotaxis protein CheW